VFGGTLNLAQSKPAELLIILRTCAQVIHVTQWPWPVTSWSWTFTALRASRV